MMENSNEHVDTVRWADDIEANESVMSFRRSMLNMPTLNVIDDQENSGIVVFEDDSSLMYDSESKDIEYDNSESGRTQDLTLSSSKDELTDDQQQLTASYHMHHPFMKGFYEKERSGENIIHDLTPYLIQAGSSLPRRYCEYYLKRKEYIPVQVFLKGLLDLTSRRPTHDEEGWFMYLKGSYDTAKLNLNTGLKDWEQKAHDLWSDMSILHGEWHTKAEQIKLDNAVLKQTVERSNELIEKCERALLHQTRTPVPHTKGSISSSLSSGSSVTPSRQKMTVGSTDRFRIGPGIFVRENGEIKLTNKKDLTPSEFEYIKEIASDKGFLLAVDKAMTPARFEEYKLMRERNIEIPTAVKHAYTKQ